MKLKIYLIKLINFYQRHASPFLGANCVFYPSCSEYAKAAIEKYGAGRGVGLAILRLLRCHPWQETHFDPVK